jgi:hypothetical protein
MSVVKVLLGLHALAVLVGAAFLWAVLTDR